MSNNPLNLALRFILEIVGVSIFAYWGWAQGGWVRWPLAILLPMIAMTAWAVFRTPQDHPVNHTIVAVPGVVRLALEIVFFGLVILALATVHANERADWLLLGLIAALLIHYALSWDRLIRLVRMPKDA
ncbi:MAG: YrdB family protein [Chloroflexota bacterium]